MTGLPVKPAAASYEGLAVSEHSQTIRDIGVRAVADSIEDSLLDDAAKLR